MEKYKNSFSYSYYEMVTNDDNFYRLPVAGQQEVGVRFFGRSCKIAELAVEDSTNSMGLHSSKSKFA